MENTYDASELFKKMAKKSLQQQREAAIRIAQDIVRQQPLDVTAAIGRIYKLNLPEVEEIAEEIAAKNAIAGIIDEV